MRTAPGPNPTKGGWAPILVIWIAAIALILAAAPRARACDVDDETDAAAEGLLHDDDDGAALARTTTSMSCKLLVPGPHLRVTTPRAPTPEDVERAKGIRAQLRHDLAKYADYRLALRDGFEIRFPNIRQKIYHFSNRTNAVYSARVGFDSLRPTSLLYEKDGAGYKLVGVMYTAPRYYSEAELDRRFPISVAPWHLHTNLCLRPPTRDQHEKRFVEDHRFGPNGSIATEQACSAAGGTFRPVLYGWMTHVDYDDPYGKE